MSHFTVGVILPQSIDLTPKPPAPPPALETMLDEHGNLVAVEAPLEANTQATAVMSVETIEEVVDAYIQSAMERYSESREVPEYDRECHCVGVAARIAVRKSMDEKYGDIAAIRESFHARADVKALNDQRRAVLVAMRELDASASDEATKEAKSDELADALNKADEEIDQLWTVMRKPYNDEYEALLDAREDKAAADPECDNCQGTGLYRSTYNPESTWDWYRVGGRWDGMLTDNRQKSENGFNFDRKHETLDNNSAKLGALLEQAGDDDKKLKTFFAVLTPDDEWIKSGDMGWWGMTANEVGEEVWHAQLRTIYEKYRDHWVVCLDCHI